MTIEDLELIKEEFEQINRTYRQTASFQERVELLERVKKLVTAIRSIGVELDS